MSEINIGALGALREVLLRALAANIRLEEAARLDDRVAQPRNTELLGALQRELGRVAYYHPRLCENNVRLFPGADLGTVRTIPVLGKIGGDDGKGAA